MTSVPGPDLPAAFAKDGAPYRLEELLCGLEPVAEPEDDDVLVLTEAMEEAPPQAEPAPAPAPAPEPDWQPTSTADGNVVAALSALAQEAPPLPAIATGDLTAQLQARIEDIIAAHQPPGAAGVPRGTPDLPHDLNALATLLADLPPDDDFTALDTLYACWPKSTQDSSSRALLAVAQNLTRNFGLPGKLPMAAAKAWRMLSPALFEAELAERLRGVGRFIAEWQQTQRTFLILEFSEIELIEYLFEALSPGRHGTLLAEVMTFKVLSNRRLGLLRRIPMRMKKQVAPMLPADRQAALVELAHAKALLENVAASTGFAPIVETADKAREDIEKMMKAIAGTDAPQVPSGALGRIG